MSDRKVIQPSLIYNTVRLISVFLFASLMVDAVYEARNKYC